MAACLNLQEDDLALEWLPGEYRFVRSNGLDISLYKSVPIYASPRRMRILFTTFTVFIYLYIHIIYYVYGIYISIHLCMRALKKK